MQSATATAAATGRRYVLHPVRLLPDAAGEHFRGPASAPRHALEATDVRGGLYATGTAGHTATAAARFPGAHVARLTAHLADRPAARRASSSGRTAGSTAATAGVGVTTAGRPAQFVDRRAEAEGPGARAAVGDAPPERTQ